MLNLDQQAAIDIGSGCTALLAGPGSGKTEVIVQRYCRLIEDGERIEEILSLSFTKESAKEMRTRAEKRVGWLRSRFANHERPSGFMTIHSLALAFANIERDYFPFQLDVNPLADPLTVAKIAAGAAKHYGVKFREFTSYVSLMKRRGMKPQDALIQACVAPDFIMAKAYKEYEEKLHKLGLLDFNDLLLEMVSVLQANTEVRDRWQYVWIQTDESQDLDNVQWRIVQFLSQRHGNVFSVGDCNQSIYEWRGASPEMFLKFHETFTGARYKYLGQNYRSTKKIVEFCREIAPIKNELLDHFRTENEEGEPIHVRVYDHDFAEASGVVDDAKVLAGVAILARTNRYLHSYEDICAAEGIPYHFLGASGFWQQEEIRNCVAFLQIAGGQANDHAVLRALRSPFHPSRGINKTLGKTLREQKQGDPNEPSILHLLWEHRAEDANQDRYINRFKAFIQGLPGLRTAASVIEQIGALDYYDEEEADIDNNPRENVLELIQIASRFPSIREFLDHVRKVTVASRVKRGIALSTVHQAKGKEWDNVFLVGACEGMLPHKSGQLDEEARIFFVACSRAAKRLSISYHGMPSQFIYRWVGECQKA